jgi:hypothetical protein
MRIQNNVRKICGYHHPIVKRRGQTLRLWTWLRRA